MNRINTLLFQGQSPLISKTLNLWSLAWLLVLALFVGSCDENNAEDPEQESAKIEFEFAHAIGNEPLLFDTLIYTNFAGNPYLVNEIQYFISDVRLYSDNGKVKLIDDWKAIHYIDTDIIATQTWVVYDAITPGNYDSVSFTFGISPERNQSFMFVNPPEKDMFWPEYLGGGYHYLKLNGKWLPGDQSNQTTPFDFHMGIGQVYHSYPDSIIGFVHNNFDVSLPGSGFSVDEGELKSLKITMHIDQWFVDPHVYDHDVFGGYIMQNQEAMQIVKENGSNVFTLEESGKHED